MGAPEGWRGKGLWSLSYSPAALHHSVALSFGVLYLTTTRAARACASTATHVVTAVHPLIPSTAVLAAAAVEVVATPDACSL